MLTVWGIQHQEAFSTKDNNFATNDGKENKNAPQILCSNLIARQLLESSWPSKAAQSKLDTCCLQSHEVKQIFFDEEFIKCCNIWPVHGVLIMTVILKNSQTAAIMTQILPLSTQPFKNLYMQHVG